MAFENVYGKAYGLDQRGRFDSFRKAVDTIFAELSVQHDEFFDSLHEHWAELFPKLKVKPGRYEDGLIFLYVPTSGQLFATRPRLKMIAKKLSTLPKAPKKIELRLEIHD